MSKRLENLVDALVEDILETPDDEILREVRDDGVEPFDWDAYREEMKAESARYRIRWK